MQITTFISFYGCSGWEGGKGEGGGGGGARGGDKESGGTETSLMNSEWERANRIMAPIPRGQAQMVNNAQKAPARASPQIFLRRAKYPPATAMALIIK